MAAIRCTVTNCRFWEENACTARAIEVNVDNGDSSALNSQETQCHTFEH